MGKRHILIICITIMILTGCIKNENTSDIPGDDNHNYNEVVKNNDENDQENSYTVDELLELLAGKLDLEKNDYTFQGEDYNGGYIYTYIMKEGDRGNPMSYVVDPVSGNIYDEISEIGIINLFHDNQYIDEDVIESEIQKNYCSSELKTTVYGFETGNVIIMLYTSTEEKKFNEVKLLTVNPFTLEVKDHDTGVLLGDLFEEQTEKITH